jgi:hypothetical protein
MPQMLPRRSYGVVTDPSFDRAFDYSRRVGSNRRYGDRSAGPSGPTRPERVHHVWVAPSARHPDMRPYPGLLVAWERRQDDWWGQVVMLLPEGAVVVSWVPRTLLRPALVERPVGGGMVPGGPRTA